MSIHPKEICFCERQRPWCDGSPQCCMLPGQTGMAVGDSGYGVAGPSGGPVAPGPTGAVDGFLSDQPRGGERTVQPWVSNHTACSRFRIISGRYIRRRTSASSMHHRTSSAPISSIPNFDPLPFPSLLLQLPPILTANDVGLTSASVWETADTTRCLRLKCLAKTPPSREGRGKRRAHCPVTCGTMPRPLRVRHSGLWLGRLGAPASFLARSARCR